MVNLPIVNYNMIIQKSAKKKQIFGEQLKKLFANLYNLEIE